VVSILAKIAIPAICTILVGGLITLYGYFAPFMVIGSWLASIACGLIYTFNPTSLPATWITYQILAGIAFGLSFQTPIMAAQALAAYEDVATTTAILYFFQLLGAAIFVSTADSIFSNILISNLRHNVPAIDPLQVIAAGAAGLREIFTPGELDGIVASYMAGLSAVFVLAVGLGCCAAVVGFGAPWVSIKGKTGMVVG
jgi:hypothetical protein